MKLINRIFFLALASFSVAIRSAESVNIKMFFLTRTGSLGAISQRITDGDKWRDVLNAVEDAAGYERFTSKLFFDGRDVLTDKFGYVSRQNVLEMKCSFFYFVPFLMGDHSQ